MMLNNNEHTMCAQLIVMTHFEAPLTVAPPRELIKRSSKSAKKSMVLTNQEALKLLVRAGKVGGLWEEVCVKTKLQSC